MKLVGPIRQPMASGESENILADLSGTASRRHYCTGGLVETESVNFSAQRPEKNKKSVRRNSSRKLLG